MITKTLKAEIRSICLDAVEKDETGNDVIYVDAPEELLNKLDRLHAVSYTAWENAFPSGVSIAGNEFEITVQR